MSDHWAQEQPGEWSAPGGYAGTGSSATPPPGAAPGWGPPPGGWQQPPTGWGPPPGGWAPPAPKPGIIPLRPLGVGEVLDGSLTYVRRNPRTVLGISVVVAAVAALVNFALTLLLDDSWRTPLDLDADPWESLSATGPATAVTLITFLVAVVFQVAATGMLTQIVGRAVLGRRLDAREAWDLMRPLFWRLLGLTLLVSLVSVGALAVLMLPGIVLLAAGAGAIGGVLLGLGAVGGIVTALWLGVGFMLSPAALVLENMGVIDSMRRSWNLVRGSWWRLFGIQLLVFLIVYLVSSVLTLPFMIGYVVAVVGGQDEPWLLLVGLVLLTLAGLITNALTMPFVAGSTALLYIDRRMRREGLDLVLQRSAADGATPPGPAPGPAPGPGPADGQQRW